jgi:hypothetical protein
MAVCGSGSAGKKQVGRMVGTLLGLPEAPSSEHAADALAVAICHAGGGPVAEAEIKVRRTTVPRTASDPGTADAKAEHVPGIGSAG